MRVLLRREIRLRVSGRYSPQIHKTWGYNRLLVRTNFKREARKASLMWTHRSYFYCVWRRWRGEWVVGRPGEPVYYPISSVPCVRTVEHPGYWKDVIMLHYSGPYPFPPVSAVSLPPPHSIQPSSLYLVLRSTSPNLTHPLFPSSTFT